MIPYPMRRENGRSPGQGGGGRGRSGRTAPDERANAYLVGVVLIVGVVAAGSIGVIALGSDALEAQQSTAEADRAEQSLLEFAHAAETAAIDDAETGVATGTFDRGELRVRDEGRVNVTHVSDAGDVDVLYEDSLGTVAYTAGDTEIAYQGGGVWRSEGGGTTTLSAPGVEYRDGSLAFPIQRLAADESGGNGLEGTLDRSAATAVEPADRSVGGLEGGTIRIELESEYCEGWERELEETLDDGVVEDCAEERSDRVRAELPVVPSTGGFDSAVIAEEITYGPGNNETQIEGDVRTDSVPEWLYNGTATDEGYDRPPVDTAVTRHRDDCDTYGDPDHVVADGTHCVDELTDGYTFDATDGDVDVVVRDGIDLSGGDDIAVDGDGALTVYVDGDVRLQGNPQIGNASDPSQTRLMIPSTGEVNDHGSGTPEVYGLVYAPDSVVALQGDPFVEGKIVGDRVELGNNNPNGIYYHESLESADSVPAGVSEARYASITVYELELER